MQIRPKTYLHFISLWRSLREAVSPHYDNVPAKASPFLILVAIVLALLLAILEVDAHRDELGALGLSGADYPVHATFLGP
jgi:hypothetical protein